MTAHLNDVNPHLINFYEWIQRGLRVRIPMTNDEAVYYRHRQRFNYLVGANRHKTSEAASLFYYLNRTGYNGLCRFNRSGQFNVPFGRHRKIAYTRDFTPYRRLLSRYRISSTDFEDIPLLRDDFIYADPPYDVDFTQYSKGGFDWEDQVRVAEWLAGHPGPVALSNQATPRIIALYKELGFVLHFMKAPRTISCNGNRDDAEEVLATRNM